MSFVSRLRMANMFPINSDLGNARIDVGNDEIDNIIARANDLGLNTPMQRPVGMQMMNPQQQPAIQQPMRFGGVVGSDSNPGADILNRARNNAESLYKSYSQPLNAPVSGPSNDEINLNTYFDRKNKEKVADATVINAQGNAGYKQAQLENAQQRIDLTRDKNQTQSELNQAKFDLTKSKEENKQLETERQKEQSEELLKQHSRDALSVLDEISSATGQFDKEGNSVEQLKPNTQNITGFSGNIPSWMMDLSPNNASARASINRLKDMLTLDRMQSLRQQSKTGSTGFGANMNQKEFQTLVSAASKLATLNQSEPAFAKELGRIRSLLRKSAGPDNINQDQNQDFEVLIDPNGVARQIPKDKVEEALKRGARRQ